MIKGAKLIGAGAATIALTGAAVGIGNGFCSLISRERNSYWRGPLCSTQNNRCSGRCFARNAIPFHLTILDKDLPRLRRKNKTDKGYGDWSEGRRRMLIKGQPFRRILIKYLVRKSALTLLIGKNFLLLLVLGVIYALWFWATPVAYCAGSASSSIPNDLALIKRSHPTLNDMDDRSLICILGKMTSDPETSKKLLLQDKLSRTPEGYDSRAVLEAFQLPEGWGHFLRSFTDRVIDGIPGGMPLTAILDITGDPSLTLLLQMVQIYALFLEDETANLGTLMSKAQELLNLFRLLAKLRHGETRLHQRLIDCVDQLLKVDR